MLRQGNSLDKLMCCAYFPEAELQAVLLGDLLGRLGLLLRFLDGGQRPARLPESLRGEEAGRELRQLLPPGLQQPVVTVEISGRGRVSGVVGEEES